MKILKLEKKGLLDAILIICILVLSIFLLLVEDYSLKLLITLFAVLLFIIKQTRQYCFKNYIRILKKSIYIRFGANKGFNILKSEIKDYRILINTLIITTANDDCFVFNTKGLYEDDLEVLKKFFDNLLKNK